MLRTGGPGRPASLAGVTGELAQITFPAELPISARRAEIAAAIRDHQVVIVAGETGSGKTTQLPKICLQVGRGDAGVIGHTQPRRLAARTVAERIAEEMGTQVGGAVGYKMRFTDRVGPQTRVKLMTDGILLAEIQSDRELRQYDTLIIDEAHERSLNVDFLLGYLKRLLPRRPDLKVVVTSATIDPDRFSRHFADAPVVEVSGRTYPVEVRYRPVADEADDRDRDQVEAICDAISELRAEAPGDVLVFLSGEREIRDTAEAVRRMNLPDTEVLPLYARLSAADQHKVFAPHGGRRVVLATNVAETSLTVPGIKYVVDPGTARISRYSHRLKVQRLPIEPVSQASANQRKGRCGRTSDGICIRLYSEEDFLARPEFTDPEILRTNLASVILQMAGLGIGELADFPFLDPPDRRQVRDGVALLHELGALQPDEPDPRKRLTPLGRRLAALPVDPRLARMVLEADRNGCVREVLVITAALSIQDPRERPVDHQQAADDSHRRFADPTSDFLAYLNLWNYLQEKQRALSSSAFRRMCRAEYLHYLRVREWQDLFGQLRQVARGMGIRLNDAPADGKQVHLSLLAGLLSHVGLRDPDKQDYLGARGARFALWPGSALFKKPPRWVMAAELVETSRLWGRDAARIEPDWIEPLAGHLVQRSYSEPHWDARRGAVMAYEKVTLYGLPVVPSRRVGYARIEPALSREIFIRHALVEGDWQAHHRFLAENQRLVEGAEELEHRARRRDIVVDDEAVFDFYDARIPADVVSARHFDRWWKTARREQPDLLTFSRSLLVAEGAGGVSEQDYPDVWRREGLELALSYRFEPGADDDGVTVSVPLAVLNRVRGEDLERHVPGLRHDVVTALLRALPKDVRRRLGPAPDLARELLPGLEPDGRPLADALAWQVLRLTGVEVSPDDVDLTRLPPHLRMRYRVVDADGRELATGRDLAALRDRLQRRLQATLADAAPELEVGGQTSWTFGSLPTVVERRLGDHAVQGFPALVDEGRSVGVRILASAVEQRRSMWSGTRRLLMLGLPSPVKPVLSQLPNRTKLALTHAPHSGAPALFDDCLTCAADFLVAEAGGPAWDADAFARLRAQVQGDLVGTVLAVVGEVADVLAVRQDVQERLAPLTAPVLAPSVADVQEHLARLVYPGFVTATGRRRLRDVVRYVRGVAHRLDKLTDDPLRDQQRMVGVHRVEQEYADLVAGLPQARRGDDDVVAVRWMLEELRVSVFAQVLGTARPVSEKRIYRAMDDVVNT